MWPLGQEKLGKNSGRQMLVKQLPLWRCVQVLLDVLCFSSESGGEKLCKQMLKYAKVWGQYKESMRKEEKTYIKLTNKSLESTTKADILKEDFFAQSKI